MEKVRLKNKALSTKTDIEHQLNSFGTIKTLYQWKHLKASEFRNVGKFNTVMLLMYVVCLNCYKGHKWKFTHHVQMVHF